MRILHDTGFGHIELYADEGVHRMDMSKHKDIIFRYVAVRTWAHYGKVDTNLKPIPPKNATCILKINDALDELVKVVPPCILVIMLDEPFRGLLKLSDKWLRFRICAIRKSDKMDEEKYLNFIGEYFNAV